MSYLYPNERRYLEGIAAQYPDHFDLILWKFGMKSIQQIADIDARFNRRDSILAMIDFTRLWISTPERRAKIISGLGGQRADIEKRKSDAKKMFHKS